MENHDTKNNVSQSVEVFLDPKNILVSMTDINGNIEYCNESFSKTTGFDIASLVGSNHTLIRHEDMPSTLYKYIWSRLKKEEELTVIIKNSNKNNDYYWTMINFIIRRSTSGNIIGYRANTKPAPKNAIKALIPLYEKLLILESSYNIGLSLTFFNNYFEHKNMTYDKYIESIINPFSNKNSSISIKETFLDKIKSIF